MISTRAGASDVSGYSHRYILSLMWAFFTQLVEALKALASTQASPTQKRLHDDGLERLLDKVKDLSEKHEVARTLQCLIETDGAGSWPPRARHVDGWPEALRPYHEVYLQLVPALSHDGILPEDIVSYNRCLEYRGRMRELLARRIDLDAVANIMASVENRDRSLLDRGAYNGFYACIALSRHAFR